MTKSWRRPPPKVRGAAAGQLNLASVATTLRGALDKADTFARSGAVVVAIARPSPHRLFIFADQVSRVAKVLQEHESV